MALRAVSMRTLGRLGAAPVSRSMSTAAPFLEKLKKREERAAGLEPHLPESLKFLVGATTDMRGEYEALLKSHPHVVETAIERYNANPKATGIVATTAEPRDPATCVYTVEGAYSHEIMTKLFEMDRFCNFLFEDVYITLGQAEKAALTTNYENFAKECFSRMKTRSPTRFKATEFEKIPPITIPDKMLFKNAAGL